MKYFVGVPFKNWSERTFDGIQNLKLISKRSFKLLKNYKI